MKTSYKLLLAIVAMLFLQSGYAQDTRKASSEKKEAGVQSLVSSKNFVFLVQSVTPLGGRVIQLGSQYDVVISNDTLKSDLPYFGRAYSAPIDPLEGGFRFTSTNFNYKIDKGKRGGWNILIEPKDNREVRQMSLSISNSGYATLQVTSNNRQVISYYGLISERDNKHP